MINTIFHFVNDPTFDYQTAVNNGDISEYTIVFNSADHSIYCKGTMFGRMSRADIAETLGNISGLIPVATDSTLGGIKIGYTNNTDLNSRRYGVVLDSNNKAYVEVPWTDTITPDFDDTELKSLIATERSRIDNFISTLSDTIDAKNRQLFADTQWVEEVFGIPQAEGSIWQKFENEIDHYLNEYMVWDWVDPEDHTKGRIAKISSIELNIDGITTRVGTAEEWIEDADDLFEGIDGDITVLQEQSSTLSQTAQAIDLRVQEVESWNVAPDGIIVSNTTRIGNVETRAGAVELRAGQLETRMTDAEGRLTSTDIALSDLELSVNGYYSVSLVSATSGAIEISTIARDASKFDSLSEGQHINDKLFSHFPVQTSVYKNSTQYFKFTRVDGAVDSLASLSSSVTSYNGTNDDNLANLIKMAASVLLLKSSENAQGQLTSMADLAAVITNGSFTGYSGLASKVSEIDGAYVSQASLTSQIQALDVSGQIATATSGLASESYVRTTAASEADDAESAAKGYADTVAASATATMYATVDEVCAGIGVTVTKDTNGAYTSVAQISADNINLNGQTNFKTAVGAFIETDVLLAGTATIDAATINSANITGTLNGVDGVFSGELSAATGSFTGIVTATGGSFKGDVTATQFIAGDEDGLNITVNGNAISFNHGSDQRAWFTTLDENGNQTDGMFLYIKNPDQTATNKVITIDFTSLTFKNVGSNQQTALQQTDIYTTITGSSVQYASSVFKGSVDGLYYSDSQLSTLLSSTQSSTHYKYVREAYVILADNTVYRLYNVKIYDKVTFASGVMTTGGGYYAILYDPSGSTLNGTEAYGTSSAGSIYNPNSTVKMGSGSSNVSVQFSTSNGYIYPYVAATSGSAGNKITLYRIVSTLYSTIITNEQDLTLHS